MTTRSTSRRPVVRLLLLLLACPFYQAHYYHAQPHAEGEECGTEHPTDKEVAQTMQLVRDYNLETTSSSSLLRSTSSNRLKRYYHIPVFAHILLQSANQKSTTGLLTDDDLRETIRLLNLAYADTPFRFYLYQITRTVNVVWHQCHKDIDDQFKQQLRQGGTDALNLYICDTSSTGLRGWASYPWRLRDDRHDPVQDGMVVHHHAIYHYRSGGGGGGGEAPEAYQAARHTLTHEVGHFLGLYHTYQGGCSDRNDGVADTPAHLSSTEDCYVPLQDTCPESAGYDPRNNYMDTGNEACRSEFTPGQIERMVVMFETFRNHNRTVDMDDEHTAPPTTAPTTTTIVSEEQGNDDDNNNNNALCVAAGLACVQDSDCCVVGSAQLICVLDECTVQNQRPLLRDRPSDSKTDDAKLFRGGGRRGNDRRLKGS